MKCIKIIRNEVTLMKIDSRFLSIIMEIFDLRCSRLRASSISAVASEIQTEGRKKALRAE